MAKSKVARIKSLIDECSDNKLQDVIAYLADRVIIPNWFFKHHSEQVFGEKLSDKKFLEFLEFVKDDTTYMDDISNDMRDLFDEYIDSREV